MAATTALDIETFQQWRRSCFHPKADLPVPDAVLRSADNDHPGDFAVADACTNALHELVTAIPLLEQGTLHRLWRIECKDGETLICRANAKPVWFRDYPLHVDRYVGTRVKNKGLPVVGAWTVDLTRRHLPTDFAILEPARGVSLRRFDDDEHIGPYLQDLGRTMARFHRIEAEDGYGLLDVQALALGPGRLRGMHATWDDFLWTKLEVHLETCISIAAVTEAEAKQIHWLFDGCRGLFSHPKPALLHGDLGNHNIFGADGKITALIDWEDALAGDPAYDIAFWATFHPECRHETLIEGYRSEADLPADFEQRFWLYFLRVSLAKTVLRHRLGLKDRPGREPAAGRVRKGLQRLNAACAVV